MFFDIENILMNYVHLIEFDTFTICNLQHQLIYIHIVSLIFPLCFLFFNVDIAFKSMDFQMAQEKKKNGGNFRASTLEAEQLLGGETCETDFLESSDWPVRRLDVYVSRYLSV